MVCLEYVLNDPGLVALYLSIYMFIVFSLVSLVYLALANKKRRITDLYLSGEPESVVSEPTPSPGHLYWGFMKRFARRLYGYLVERMHTGNLQDWVDFMFSWYGILVLLSLILGVIYVFKG